MTRAEIGKTSQFFQIVKTRISSHMSRKKVMLESFCRSWDVSVEMMSNLSKNHPERPVLWVDRFAKELRSEYRDKLFDLLWNNRLYDHKKKRVREMMNKVSQSKVEYAKWRKRYMVRTNYDNDFIGFDLIHNFEGMKKLIEYHPLISIFKQASDKVPEMVISDILQNTQKIAILRKISQTNIAFGAVGAMTGIENMMRKRKKVLMPAKEFSSNVLELLKKGSNANMETSISDNLSLNLVLASMLKILKDENIDV